MQGSIRVHDTTSRRELFAKDGLMTAIYSFATCGTRLFVAGNSRDVLIFELQAYEAEPDPAQIVEAAAANVVDGAPSSPQGVQRDWLVRAEVAGRPVVGVTL
eukprot:3588110-Prymnesium_polylepis.1